MPSALPAGLTETWGWAVALLVAKATLVLAAAALAAWALRRGSAARRHLVWTMAMGALLALPALSLGLPEWEPALLAIDTLGAGAAAEGAAAPPGGAGTGVVLAALWAAGALAVLARLALGLLGVRRVARDARAVTDPAWTAEVRALGARVGVRGPVRLLRGAAAMPATWGIVRPTVLLPAEAQGWTDERRRVVLLHELAHVARRDCLTQLLATLCCAVYWFHPGAWWAARRMRVEREEACDDRVLASGGTRASDYAEHLLAVARAFRLPRPAAPALAMARGSQLQARVMAVLDARRDRRSVPRAAGAVWATAALAALLPLAVVGPSERERPAPAAPAPRIAHAGGEVKRVEAEGLLMEVRVTPAPAAVAAAPPAPPRAEPAPALAVPVRARERVRPASTLAALIRATTHPEPRVRRGAVEALGRLGDDAVVTPLVRSLRDRDSDVRTLAARVLGELAGGRPAPGDVHAIPVGAGARRAIGDAAAGRAAEALRLTLADENAKVRDAALWALGELGGSGGGTVPLGGQPTNGVVSTLEGGPGMD
jgi:beta-lactamase regulating signal transducer with metallopeptidase domain